MKKRIVSGVALVAAGLLAALFLPRVAAWPVFAIITILIQGEFYRLFQGGGIPVFDRIGLLLGVAYVSAVFWGSAVQPPSGLAGRLTPAEWELLVIATAVILILVRQLPQKFNDQPIPTVSGTLIGFFYIPVMMGFMVRLALAFDRVPLRANLGPGGLYLILTLIFTVKMSDAGAYFVGRAFGRTKLFPRISPMKTWEGLCGGIVTGTAAAFAVFFLCGQSAADGGRHIGSLAVSAADVLAMALLLTCMGAVGDLVESLLKRAVGAKDSGATIPGMGGLLDIFDSLLLTSPLLFFYARVFLT